MPERFVCTTLAKKALILFLPSFLKKAANWGACGSSPQRGRGAMALVKVVTGQTLRKTGVCGESASG